MRTLLLIAILFSISTCYAQETGRTFHFAAVGWTIVIPPDFRVIDSAVDASMTKLGEKYAERTLHVKAGEYTKKSLISATKPYGTMFNAAVVALDTAMEAQYADIVQSQKDMMYKMMVQQMPRAKIDSSSATVMIGGLDFDQFHITMEFMKARPDNLFVLAKYYKGYNFIITYSCQDEKTKAQIETMLQNSRFNK